MLDEREVEKTLKLKDSFRQTPFFSRGLIYLNERIKNTNEDIKSLADLGVDGSNYTHVLATGTGVPAARKVRGHLSCA